MLKSLIAPALIVASLSACAPNYSEGERVGVITKFSNKGLVFKSWEGSLNQGGTKRVSNGDGGYNTVANAVGFNVSDETIIAEVREAANANRVVKLTYSQWFIKPPFIDHSRVITAVDYVD